MEMAKLSKYRVYPEGDFIGRLNGMSETVTGFTIVGDRSMLACI